MTETWLEEKHWGEMKKGLAKGYKWRYQSAKRTSKKGRASGGIIVAVRKGLEEVHGGEEEKYEGILMRNMMWEGVCWKIITVYVKV